MAGVTIGLSSSCLPSPLQEVLDLDAIQPGDTPSYQACKLIYLHHPIGAKLVEAPINLAQSQQREITVQSGPEEVLKEAFVKEWRAIHADRYIKQCQALARVYGLSATAVMVKGEAPGKPLDLKKLANEDISFNVFDPLNISGSTTLNQNPNDRDFLKTTGIVVAGVEYHPSRCVMQMNEMPIYLGYSSSAFGYVGRSVYQRALYPLKTFLQTMVADDMLANKVGVLIAKLRMAGGIIDKVQQAMAGLKRDILQEARNKNVISISTEESIESLSLQNMDAPLALVRKHSLENVALASGTPAKLLTQESFAEGFGEGIEDAKHIADAIDGLREDMRPLYEFFDKIVQHRAWNPAFYKTIQKRFPEEYGSVAYEAAFPTWVNSFVATWPSLLKEPDSEKVKVDETKYKATESVLVSFLPQMDPDNKARVFEWAQDNINSMPLLFPNKMDLDIEAIRDYEPPAMELAESGEDGTSETEEPKPKKPATRADSVVMPLVGRRSDWLKSLAETGE